MEPIEVQVLECKGKRVFVVGSYRDADTDVDGLPAAVRAGILLGVLRAVEQGYAKGPGARQRERDFVELVSLEILFGLIFQRKLAWGLESKAVREARRRSQFSGTFRRIPTHKARPPYLLDFVDWEPVDPWLASLNYPHEIRKRYRELKERLFGRGPFLSNLWLQWHVLERLGEMWSPEGTEVDVRAWMRAVRKRQSVWLEPLRIHYHPRMLGRVLDYYGTGEPGRTNGERGYFIRHWNITRILYRMRREGGLDLRSLPWMAGRYWLIEDLPRYGIGDFPLE